jgi:RNA polymerase sigma-70 factor (ECF subfamily)
VSTISFGCPPTVYSRRRSLDLTERTNQQWLEQLRSTGPDQEQALADLREIVASGLPFSLSKWLRPSDPLFDALVEEVAQNTLIRVLESLDSFEGRSKFTTWVHKIAVRIALTELRRKRWKDVSLDELTAGELSFSFLADDRAGPDQLTEQADLVERVRKLIEEQLTERQRKALVAIQIHGMAMDEVARQLDTNRNALYKLLHDARQNLKKAMADQGLTPEDVLAAFESR